jgi:hypothetical protein
MNKAHSVILNQTGVNLVASVFATRDGIASASKVDDYTDGYAVKVTANDQLKDGDFVVRSVRYGSRRKLVVLFGRVDASVVRSLPEFDSAEEMNARESFAEGDTIWMTDGNELVNVANAVTLAAHKKVS